MRHDEPMEVPTTPRGPASIEWRVHIAGLAMWFFHFQQTEQLAALGREPDPERLTPLTGIDFVQYLDARSWVWPLAVGASDRADPATLGGRGTCDDGARWFGRPHD